MSDSLPVTPGRRRLVAIATSDVRDPLLRNGYALVVGSGMTSVIGVVFWIVAAHRYDPAQIGRNSVAITTISFIGAVSQFSLISALTRFIPRAGRRTGRLVACSYAVTMAIAALFAGAFELLVSHIEPGLDFIVHDAWLAVAFVIASALWTVFILEDGVLTGLRKAPVVPLENAAFSILKVALLVPLAGVLPGAGVFLAWVVSSAATVVPTNCYIFGWAIPRHHRNARDGDGVTVRQLRDFVVSDYLGSMFWLAATALLPLIILKRSGGAASAYFSLAWLVAYSFYLVSLNIGSSLVVEAASDQSMLASECKRILVHLTKVIVPCVIAVVVLAPEILRLFGRSYSADGATALRLLALSAVPYIVVGTAESAYRVQRRTRPLIFVNAVLFLVVVPLSWILLPRHGVAGVGFAWLLAVLIDATILVVIRGSWLGTAPWAKAPPALNGQCRADESSAVRSTEHLAGHGSGDRSEDR